MKLPPAPTHEKLLQVAARYCQPGCLHQDCIISRVRPIITRHSSATPGPWRWNGSSKARDLRLSTTHSGRHHVMDFVRWGMSEAQPRFQPPGGLMVRAADLLQHPHEESSTIVGINHPDALLMERAWEDMNQLLGLLTAVLAGDWP